MTSRKLEEEFAKPIPDFNELGILTHSLISFLMNFFFKNDYFYFRL